MDEHVTDRQTDSKHCRACGQFIAEKVRRVGGNGGRCRLYHNDFRDLAGEIIPGSIDAVIADPPYGSGGFLARDVMKSSKQKYVSSDASYQQTLPDIDGDSLHPMAWRQLMHDACLFAWRVLSDRGVLALFIDWRNLPVLQAAIHECGFTLRGMAVWDKGNASRPYKNGFRMQTEFLLWATKGKMPSRDDPVYLPGVLKANTMSNGKLHITQKPESLMDEVVKICPSGGTVFDPFMGSGTTGVAALNSGRKFVGCESVEQYFETAKMRCLAVEA